MSSLTFNRIKELLGKYGKTNIELAEYAKVSVHTVSFWCNNYTQPSVDKLFKIADFFSIEAGEVLTLKKDLRVPGPKRKNKTSKGIPVQKKSVSKKKKARA